MIDPRLINFFDSMVSDYNPKQKKIAEELMINPTYQIIKVYEYKNPKLYLKNINDGGIIDFERYVKSKCDC